MTESSTITVADIMDAEPLSVAPDTDVETVVRTLKEQELPGVPVVNEVGRLVGIVTEADLIIGGDDGDLHLPHYIELFGGVIYLESLKKYEERLRKAFAGTAADMMTKDPDTIGPEATVQEAAKLISRSGHNRIPVVEHGLLVGVVTRIDVLQALAGE
ncbi:CBS domain-containing protein [Paraconexibacter antarcticus]|uniref:CBS domain-containing protein n=1 Tax=Paraconexibacter antarcticus TaxID=2949664 RepID=A0ABY5E045_9ACTN|nr:CBS domain-containing protein [Paraconexibacter antarcticus]UTI66988.1 CBS domain-containing protein [Paraconexibacter antarcticus]